MILAVTPGILLLLPHLSLDLRVKVSAMRGSGSRQKSRRRLAAIASAVFFLLAGPVIEQASANMDLTGKAGLIASRAGSGWKVLVPAKLPLEYSGRPVTGDIRIALPNAVWNSKWEGRPHAGSLRLNDRRAEFRFNFGVPVPVRIARAILRNGKRATVRVEAKYIDQLTATADSSDRTQEGIGRAGPGQCETVPRIRVRAGTDAPKVTRAFPACGRQLVWRLTESPERGVFSPSRFSFDYRARGRQAGADELKVEGYFRGRLVASQKIHIRVGLMTAANAEKLSVVAFGDSVTAGFGYFGATGKPMTIGQLLGCKPGATTLNDACSSNSYNRSSSVGAKPNYLPDYGLSRNISWAAQWANEYGITNFKNLAVTGSAPTDWLPGGQLHSTLEQIQTQDPDYILMTLGANPLLSDVLFNVDVMGCALESDLFGDFRQCVLDAFATVDLGPRMNQVFTELVQNTTSNIVLMQYPLSIPSSAIAYSATQLEQMESLLNEVIASEAAEVSASRINIVSPPRFNVGIDMEPMYPSKFSCSFFGYTVDGPSVQSTPTQDELEIDHPLSFCPGPAIGPPWVISGDTGIHPSAAGYFQMASQIPAPGS